MNKEQFDLLNIDNEEKIIIEKLNKRLVNLNQNIDEYFNQSEILSYDSVSSAFLSKSDPATLANKYSVIVNKFNEIIGKIINTYQEETIIKESNNKYEDETNLIHQIDKSLENRGEFFTKKIKQRITNLALDIREETIAIEPDNMKQIDMIKEYNLLLQQLMVLTSNEGFIKVDSIANDLQTLQNLEVKPVVARTKFNKKQVFYVVEALVLFMTLLGVQTWLLLIA